MYTVRRQSSYLCSSRFTCSPSCFSHLPSPSRTWGAALLRCVLLALRVRLSASLVFHFLPPSLAFSPPLSHHYSSAPSVVNLQPPPRRLCLSLRRVHCAAKWALCATVVLLFLPASCGCCCLSLSSTLPPSPSRVCVCSRLRVWVCVCVLCASSPVFPCLASSLSRRPCLQRVWVSFCGSFSPPCAPPSSLVLAGTGVVGVVRPPHPRLHPPRLPLPHLPCSHPWETCRTTTPRKDGRKGVAVDLFALPLLPPTPLSLVFSAFVHCVWACLARGVRCRVCECVRVWKWGPAVASPSRHDKNPPPPLLPSPPHTLTPTATDRLHWQSCVISIL